MDSVRSSALIGPIGKRVASTLGPLPTAAPSFSFWMKIGLHAAQTQVDPYWIALSLVKVPRHSMQVTSFDAAPSAPPITGGAPAGGIAPAVGRTLLSGCQLAIPSRQTRSAGLIWPDCTIASNWASSTGP